MIKQIQLIFELAENKIIIPVNPDHIKINIPGRNEKVDILSLGEVLILRKPGLASFAIASFFPSDEDPEGYVNFLSAWMELNKPATFIGEGLNIDMQVAIENFSHERRAGEEDDYYYELSFTEYRPYAARVIDITKVSESGTTATETTSAKTRQDNKKPTGQIYTVKKGDTLWGITKKLSGNGANWKELYNANKGIIGNNPDLINIGIKLAVPDKWVTK